MVKTNKTKTHMQRIPLHFSLTLLLLLAIINTAENKPRGGGNYKITTVVIDAGHGGHDIGCEGSSVFEKNMTLAISLKLGEYITKYFPEVKVIYTRSTDVFIELHERANIANRNNADLFISIHCNSGPSSAYGTETFVLGLHRSETNLEVAKRENAVILMEDSYEANYDGFDPNSPEAHIMLSLAQNAHIDQSILLASKIEAQFTDHYQRKSRGVKQAGFIVLYQSTMPSVLVETGFLTNTTEEAYMMSEDGQAYIASAIYRAFKEYKSEMEGVVDVVLDDELAVPQNVGIIGDKSNNTQIIEPPKNDEPNEKGIIFKIQILASSAEIPLDDSQFGMFPKVEFEIANNWYKYMVGAFADLNDALTYQKNLTNSAFADAFVIAYKNGTRISMDDAKEELGMR